MRLRNICWYLGVFLIADALINLLSLIVAFIYGEDPVPILSLVIIAMILGGILIKTFPRREISFSETMMLVVITFIAVSLLGAIPYMFVLSGNIENVIIDSIFESVSGYTTTGLTIFPKEIYLNQDNGVYHSLIFRRTLSEWIGGLGIVILFLSLFARGGLSSVYLYKIAYGNEKIAPSVAHTSRIVLRIYLFYTLVGTILFYLSGIDAFHAICATMSLLATGGFIGNVFSDANFKFNLVTEIIIMSIMLIAAIPFTIHQKVFSRNLTKKDLKYIEVKWLFLIVISSILIYIVVASKHNIDPISNLDQIGIGVISIVTTTGYSSGDLHTNLQDESKGLDTLSDSSKVLVFLLMSIGACAGSTAGGLKIVRLTILWSTFKNFIKKCSLPEHAIVPIKIEKRIFSIEEVKTVALFFFIYLSLEIISAQLILLSMEFSNMNIDVGDAMVVSASALGTNGISPRDIRELPAITKIILIIEMLAGRLEIIPLFALFGYILKKTVEKERVTLEDSIKMIKKLSRMK